MHKRRVSIVAMAATAGLLAPTAIGRADAAFTPHASLVPETPARGYPIILGTPQYTTTNENCPNACTLSREVYAADQSGRFIAAGGNFYEIELQDASVLQQKYFAAWNIDTKQLACGGKFVFNGNVRAVEPAAKAGQVYVGGDFTKVSGADGVLKTRNKVALIDLNTCAVDSIFASVGANAKINEVVLVGARLFVGGDFTSIGSQSRRYVAELDAITGAAKPAFLLTFGTNSLASKIRGMGASPDGKTLLFGGRFGTVADAARTLTTQTAIVDISDPANPKLKNHTFMQTHQEYGNRPTGQSMQDVSVSPDGTAFGVAYGTATVSDYVYVVNAVEGAQPVRWRHYMGDTSSGIALSNNAVYVAGHFCKIENGPGPAQTMSPRMGLDTCTGSQTFPSGVWRSHLAALSLSDGTPLTWNPGQDSVFGGQEINVTTRGLLVGFDGQRANSVRTGALSFFDFGPAVEDTTAPSVVTFTAPAAGGTVNNPATISGTATDNTSVATFRVRIKAADGRWVQADGTLSATAYEFKPVAAANGSFSISVTMPAGAYKVEAKAVDIVGLISATWVSRSFTQSGTEGVPPQSTLVTNPVSPIPSETGIALSGRATDNVAVATVAVRVTNAVGLYLQADKTFAATAVDYPLTTGTLNNPTVDWSADLGALLPPGIYTVVATVKDPSGNVANPTITFTVTAVAPAVAVADPAPKILSTQPWVLNGTATDNLAVASVTAKLTNAAGLILQDDATFSAAANDLNLVITGINTASLSYTFTGGLLPEGTYNLTVTATDRVNNVTTVTRAFATAASLARPAVTAYSGYTASSEFFDYTMGFTFKVAANTPVSALGVQDTNGNGVLDNLVDTPVGIWRVSDRTLIATVNVPNNTGVDAGWFYANLPASVTLQAGVTYAIGQRVYPGREPAARNGTATEGAGFDYLGTAYAFGGSLTYPWAQATASGGFGMPNMKLV